MKAGRPVLLVLCLFASVVFLGYRFYSVNGPNFHAGDVAVLRRIKKENDVFGTLNWSGSDYGSWDGVFWDGNDKNNRVRRLRIESCRLKGKLDITGLAEIAGLDCSSNDLTDLIANDLKKLQYIYCARNRLTSLEFSGTENLTEIRCASNYLSELDVAPLTRLLTLLCEENQLTALNVAPLTKLIYSTFASP